MQPQYKVIVFEDDVVGADRYHSIGDAYARDDGSILVVFTEDTEEPHGMFVLVPARNKQN